jgi:Arc/MetJ family transcription regulator
VGTRKTSVEIDEDLLNAAKRILETTTIRDTVEEALLRLPGGGQAAGGETLTRMNELDPADPDVMAGAWRS